MTPQEEEKLRKDTLRILMEASIAKTITNRCILLGAAIGLIVAICQHDYVAILIGAGIGAIASWFLLDWNLFKAEEVNIEVKKKRYQEKLVSIQEEITVLQTNLPQDTMNLTEEHTMAVKKLRLQERKLAQTQIMIDIYDMAL
ncbi:MAG: hypothetical protein NTX91_01380 [candidate division SR1 bacterium]|nr:hypothetical protein [candidate division SR1 bacterium]